MARFSSARPNRPRSQGTLSQFSRERPGNWAYFEDYWLLMQFFKDAINSFDRDKSNSGKESKEKRVRIN